MDNFKGTNVVIAWVIGIGDKQRMWFAPFSEWETKAKQPVRRDGMSYARRGGQTTINASANCGSSRSA